MFRLLFSLFFWVTIARWGYEEIELFSPDTTKHLDNLLELTTLPTHDQWPQIQIEEEQGSYTIKLLSRESEDPAFELSYEKLSNLIEE